VDHATHLRRRFDLVRRRTIQQQFVPTIATTITTITTITNITNNNGGLSVVPATTVPSTLAVQILFLCFGVLAAYG